MHINLIRENYLLVGLKSGLVEVYDVNTKAKVKRFEF